MAKRMHSMYSIVLIQQIRGWRPGMVWSARPRLRSGLQFNSMSVQLLRHVKNALIIAVFVICTILMTLGWKTFYPVIQTVRPYSHTVDLTTSTTPGDNVAVAAEPAVVAKTDRSPKDDSCVNPNVTVLGRPLDICAASEAVKLVEEEDIYFSVKTAGKNNITRMLPVLLTWFQTIKPNRVNCNNMCMVHTINWAFPFYKQTPPPPPPPLLRSGK